jgi:hypothetical protein
MNNPTFEVYLNAELLTVAGITAEFGVVTAILTWVNSHVMEHKDLNLNVSGLNSKEDEYVSWIQSEVKVGDEITIRITNNDTLSTPTVKPKLTDEEMMARKLRHYHKLTEELKDYL